MARRRPESAQRTALGGLSHRIGDVDEAVLDAEPFRDALAEGADAERLGRVVARCDEVDPGLAGLGHRGLGRLAGEDRV